MMDKACDYDVIIAGGGLAGLSLACALSLSGNWRIAIVEAQDPLPEKPASFDERVLALSAMTVRILKVLQLWPQLEGHGAAIGQIHVSDQGSYGKTRLYATQHGLTEFGRVMPARILGKVLQQQANELAIDWYRPAQIVATEVMAHSREVTLNTGQKIRGKLLVVAEGAASATCQLLGIEAQHHDYQHVAMIANVTTDKPHQNWAFERFTPNGPLALLPLPDNGRSLVWTQPPDRAQALMSLTHEEFKGQLQQALGYRYGVLDRVGERYSYPLQLRLVEQGIRSRAVILGNAAHALHPIAGQGFNLGLRDVMELALQLNQRRRQAPETFDAGEYSLLSAYEQARSPDQQGVANATHSLALLFSNDIYPLQLGRSLGLCTLGHLQTARDSLVQQAMGLTALSTPPEDLLNA